MKTYLITGSSGFIGFNLAKRLLLEKDILVVGLDNMNDYYDLDLKEYRLNSLKEYSNFKFIEGNITNKEFMLELFSKYKFDIVINLAAQAGVRYSIDNPDSYIETNIIGFYNILEACRYNTPKHLIYASSSSVYGNNTKVPFSTLDKVDTPVSLYAATKKSDELLAHAYSKLYDIPCTGLRFFTVYGPAGRPDMAYFSFTNKLINGEKIKIFNHGNCMRDFTYIDDVVEGIMRVINKTPNSLYNIYNIGNGKPINLLDFVDVLSKELIREELLSKDYDLESHLELVSRQDGDVEVTYADTETFEKEFKFRPKTTLKKGLSEFIKWYKEFYIDENK